MDFEAFKIIADSTDFDDALLNLKKAGYKISIVVEREEEADDK